MDELDKQAGVGSALRTYLKRVSGREAGLAHSDLNALRRASEIATDAEVPRLLHKDIQKARDALELAQIKQFDSRATTGIVGAAGAGAALAGGHEYFQRQNKKDMERYYQRPIHKRAGLGSIAKGMASKANNAVRHAKGNNINTYLDSQMGWSKATRKKYLKSNPQEQASQINKSVNSSDKRKVLRDLGKLHAKRRAARVGIASIGGGTIGTSYAVSKHKQKKKRQKRLRDYLPESQTEFQPTIQLSESPHYFKGVY